MGTNRFEQNGHRALSGLGVSSLCRIKCPLKHSGGQRVSNSVGSDVVLGKDGFKGHIA